MSQSAFSMTVSSLLSAQGRAEHRWTRNVTDKNRPQFATRLRALRQRKRFSLRGLGHAAELSATYLRTLEHGYDPRTGKLVSPSVDVIKRLSIALGDGFEDEETRIFRELMVAAEYMPSRSLREARAPYRAEDERSTSIEAIAESIRRTDELSDEDKAAFIRLIERSRLILRGKPDPDQ